MFQGQATSTQASPSSAPSSLAVGQKREAPKFAAYAIPAAREATFASWPRSSPMSAQNLSRAGFFYTGQLGLSPFTPYTIVKSLAI